MSMMGQKNREAEFAKVVQYIGQHLFQTGFRQEGLRFIKVTGTNRGIVEFQKSVGTTSDSLRFTLNIGISIGELLDGPAGRRPGAMDAHVRQRIGGLLPEPADRWWTIDESTDLHSVCRELADLVLNFALPFLDRYTGTDEVLALWESGRSPGLTEVQRSRLLGRLRRLRVGN